MALQYGQCTIARQARQPSLVIGIPAAVSPAIQEVANAAASGLVALPRHVGNGPNSTTGTIAHARGLTPHSMESAMDESTFWRSANRQRSTRPLAGCAAALTLLVLVLWPHELAA